MTCSECSTENEAGRKFCKECGAPLALVCPTCGASNSGDSKFCGECGSTLTSTATPAPDQRRRSHHGTALRLRAVRRPRRVHDALGTPGCGRRARAPHPVLRRRRATIERHGGVVEKFIGDAVMAVWGTPVAHEDDAERAVRTALELVDAVQALGRDVAIDLHARAGVLTGEAAATVGDTSQGMVTGDLVNTASRLQSAAEPGTVLVGDATHSAASKARSRSKRSARSR